MRVVVMRVVVMRAVVVTVVVVRFGVRACTVRRYADETTPGGRHRKPAAPRAGVPGARQPLVRFPAFRTVISQGAPAPPDDAGTPRHRGFCGLPQLAELSFTLSVLGVTGDHKGCPGVVDFSHP